MDVTELRERNLKLRLSCCWRLRLGRAMGGRRVNDVVVGENLRTLEDESEKFSCECKATIME